MHVQVLLHIALTLAGFVAAAPASRSIEKRHSHCWSYNTQGCQYPIVGKNGAVATEVGTCSEIGVDILRQGGNAADAMVASSLCVGVIASYHSGIGGGGFMVVRYNNPNGTHGYESIDFRETMPAAGNETMYSQFGPNQTESTIGGLSSGVPGELRGWETLHKRHGKLPWAALFQPAIGVARGGFPVNVDLAGFLNSSASWILNDTYFSKVYAPNGTILQEGEYCYKPDLANTLERIANEGADVFYKDSSIANNTIARINATGGIMTLDDLAGYEAIVRPAAMIKYRSGTITLSALKIFSGFDGSAQDDDPAINLTTHRIIEATKFAYGQRATLADPAFVPNVTELEFAYLTDKVADEARSRIVSNETFPTSYYNPSDYYTSRESGTSHLATVDSTGMAVSLTTTVNLIFGSRVMTPDGFIMNDEMDDFSQPGQVNSFGFAASPINYVQPENAETGELVMATGSAGGSRIITTTLQEVYHYVDQHLNATMCTRHPRWHDQLNGITYVELPDLDPLYNLVGYNNGTVGYLRNMGYNITYQNPLSGSTSHAIGRLPNGEWLAASDPRKAAGYGAAY